MLKKNIILSAKNRIKFELIKGTLNSSRKEMEALIARTAMSPFIREKKDFFTAILNQKGELIVSTSLTLAGNLIQGIFEHYPYDTMSEGDLYIYNDCYSSYGAVSHLPDMVFVMPVFCKAELVAFVECWGHLWDIGGGVSGSISPNATSVFQEGIMIPPVKVINKGKINKEIIKIFLNNSRFPELLEGDLNSLMAACKLGKKRMEDCIERHGKRLFLLACEEIIQQTEKAFKTEIKKQIPEGKWRFRDYIDSDSVSQNSYYVDLVLEKQNGKLKLNFTNTINEAKGPINFLMDDSVPKFMMGLYMTKNIPGIIMNAGFQRAIKKIVKKKGSLVAPNFPSSLGLRSHTMFRVNSAIFGVLAQALKGKSSAASAVYVLYYLRGKSPITGKEELCIEGLSVGYGARFFQDGIDAVYYVAQENYPIEFSETEFGINIERFGLNMDSGGPGRYRGGCGIYRDIRVHLEDATLGVRIDNCKFPAFGISGGKSGGSGKIIVNPDSNNSRILRTISDNNKLKYGDLVRIVTPGGGGWGEPYQRPPEDVFNDFKNGIISYKSCLKDYGVILTKDKKLVDLKKTINNRKKIKKTKKMFHRKNYYDAHEEINII